MSKIRPRIEMEGRTRLEEVIPLDTPYLVFLDPSDKCNFSCPFCPTGNQGRFSRTRKVMSFGLFTKIIGQLEKMPSPIKTLRLYKDGEPFLNPKMIDMVRYAKNTGKFRAVDTTTNGSLLSPKLNAEIVSSGLDRIVISVPQNYSPAYLRNVQDLNVRVQDHGGPVIHVKIIGDDLSDHEKEAFYSDFDGCSNEMFIENKAPCWPGFDQGEVNKEVGIYGQEVTRVEVCPYIFYSTSINSNGTVSLCFLDWNHKMILGDLNDTDFKDIWCGNALRDIRINHLVNHRMTYPLCKECGQLSHGAPDDIDEHAPIILSRILDRPCYQDKKRTFTSYRPEEKLISFSNEKELWNEVILLAVESSKWVPTGDESVNHLEELKVEKERARRWIADKGTMFDLICRIIDIDPERARAGIMSQWG